MKKIVLFTLLSIFLSCDNLTKKESSEVKKESSTEEVPAADSDITNDEVLNEAPTETTWGTSYVNAESGLLCRDQPNGKVIHKFPYGVEVEIIQITDEQLTIVDNGKEVTGNWTEVRIDDSGNTGYVFDGFLTSMTLELDVEKIAELTPTDFIEVSNQKAILLSGKHNVYDSDLNIINQISLNSISDVHLLGVTKFERPEKKANATRKQWQDYCEWANYVKIKYKNEELILFGKNLFQIESDNTHAFNNDSIHFILASNFLKKTGTLTEELSGCAAGSYFIIKSKKEYSFVKDNTSKEEYSLFFNNNEYGSSSIHNETSKKDTIYAEVTQSFQEGVGAYKLKIFKNDGWEFIEYDKTRDYEQL